MKEERILNVLSKVDEKYIKEADPEVKVKRKAPVWTKLAAMAACLCLIVAVSIITTPNSNKKPSVVPPSSSEDIYFPNNPQGENDWYYNGCLYIIGSDYDTGGMEVFGLPWPIEQAFIGEQCGNVYRWDGHDVGYTEVPVYNYTALDVEAVKISTDINGNYCYITFLANSKGIENGESVIMGEHISEYYGVNYESIASITVETGLTDNGVLSKVISDPDTLKHFYDTIMSLDGKWYSVTEMPSGIDRYITITLKNGIDLILYYYDEVGYLRCGNAGFQLSNEADNYISQLCLFDN